MNVISLLFHNFLLVYVFLGDFEMRCTMRVISLLFHNFLGVFSTSQKAFYAQVTLQIYITTNKKHIYIGTTYAIDDCATYFRLNHFSLVRKYEVFLFCPISHILVAYLLHIYRF